MCVCYREQVGILANSSKKLHALVGHAENGDMWLALAARAFPAGESEREREREAEVERERERQG